MICDMVLGCDMGGRIGGSVDTFSPGKMWLTLRLGSRFRKRHTFVFPYQEACDHVHELPAVVYVYGIYAR